MKEQVILHIGMPKTGTTQLQYSLGKSASLLEDWKILYPTTGCYYAAGGSNHKFLAWDFMARLPPSGFVSKQMAAHSLNCIFGSVKELVRDVEASKCHTVILSSEYFFQAARYPTEVKRLKTLLLSIARRVVVVCYVREHLSWMASAYNQACKVAIKDMPSFESWAHENRYEYRLHPLLTAWANAFGKENIIVRPYVKGSLVDGDVVADFFSAAQLPQHLATRLQQPARANSAISLRTAEAIRLINKRIASAPEKEQVAKLLARANILPDRPNEGVIRSDTQRMLGAFFEGDRRDLFRDFLNAQSNDASPIGPSYSKEWYGGITRAELNEALSVLRQRTMMRP